jgi:hypothetical protein
VIEITPPPYEILLLKATISPHHPAPTHTHTHTLKMVFLKKILIFFGLQNNLFTEKFGDLSRFSQI